MAFLNFRSGWVVGIILSGAVLCLGLSAEAASPGMPDYVGDLRKKKPSHYRAYLKILPAKLKHLPWFGRLDGTGMPLERVMINGNTYYASSICKPHDCADNFLTFLVEVDGSRTVAMVKAPEVGSRVVELGRPTAAEREFMEKEFED
jgi:hypothetical protein